jgi:hypothetical protein
MTIIRYTYTIKYVLVCADMYETSDAIKDFTEKWQILRDSLISWSKLQQIKCQYLGKCGNDMKTYLAVDLI